MIRTLFIIAGSAFLLCLISFAGAAALGGADIQREGLSWTIDEDENGLEVHRGERDDSPTVTRTLEWTGGDRLQTDVPAEIVFTQGDTAEVRATGPQSLVDRLRLVDGRLTLQEFLDSEGTRTVRSSTTTIRWNSKTYGPEGLKVFITAPDVRRFELQGSGDVTIRDYDQDTMVIDLSGSGNVVAAGRTRALELDISGSGDVDLASLTTEDADVDLAGSGNASVAPTGFADISISGSGEVDLTTRPARLNQDISGSGSVDQR